MLATYEPDMDFFKAIYFNFVTLTSIGLGDIVPRSETYLLLTIIYITVGLALTTIAIEIAADTLKKLHYFGRKIENVGNVAIWFGGKKITMKALVKNLGDQFNLPTSVMKDLDLDHFVDQAIKVEEGEIETLRPPPFVPDSAGFQEFAFVDESKEEEVREWSPIPTSVSSTRETTPPRSPIPAPQEITPLLREPTPIAEPEREPSVEIEPQHNPEPQSVIETEPEPKPEQSQEQASSVKVRLLTTEDIVPRKGRVYSEEAKRRYMEYQKQWKKFRQTQRMGSFIFEESGRDLDGTSVTKNSQT
uniref:Ion_trans_2 domain-containing protein n=1 Tax=Angiostrongylus cantonensis TaxID=6313 RepID=A0A158P894_ANGCA